MLLPEIPNILVYRARSFLLYHISFDFSLKNLFDLEMFIGEGNGNPLQCSCLENPRGGGAWWASVYGVAQSWTRLKRLSSSSRNVHTKTFKAYTCLYIKNNSSASFIMPKSLTSQEQRLLTVF